MCLHVGTKNKNCVFALKAYAFVDGAQNAANLRITCEMLPVDLRIKCKYLLLLNPPLMTYDPCIHPYTLAPRSLSRLAV